MTEHEITYSIEEACRLLKLSKPTLYDEINRGRLRTYTVGRRRLVSATAARAWIEAREQEAADAERRAVSGETKAAIG